MRLSKKKVHTLTPTSALVPGEKQAQARKPGGRDPEKDAVQDIRMNQILGERAKCLDLSYSTAHSFVLIAEENP